MDPTSIILTIAILLGLYMAWNIGANDIANSMGSAVGAKAISLKQAVFIGSILCLVGAILVGGHVTDTIKKGIINTSYIQDPSMLIKGLLATLAAAGVWVTFATWRAWPVSTTHSIVGALVGFGLFSGGRQTIIWSKLIGVVISWIGGPLLAGFLAFIIFRIIRRFILMAKDSKKACLNITPIFVGLTFFIIILSVLLKTPFGKGLSISLWEGIIIGVIFGLIGVFTGRIWISAVLRKGWDVEQVFRILQIMTSGYIAFSIGANDVANAIGPVAGVMSIIKNNTITSSVAVPIHLLALGGVGILIGIMTWGYRVIATIGSKITKITNTRGFAIDFSAATSVLLASKLGMPVSTTHAVIGAVCGMGIARGLDAVDFRIVRKILISWIVTLPVATGTCILFFKLFDYIF